MATGACIAAPRLGDRSGRQQARQDGFSLIEMMVTITIMGIILAIAVPAYNTWRQSTALQSATETLMAHIKQARLLAVSDNREVKIDFATNSYTVDSSNASGSHQYQLSQYSKDLQLTAAFYHPPSATPNTTLTFESDGTATQGSVIIKNGNGSTRTIAVNLVGRAYD